MDQPGHDRAVLADNLGDLRRVNRLLGGVSLTLGGLDRLVREIPAGAELAVLDVATGGADIPRAMRAWSRRRGLRLRAVATDLSADILGLAAGRGGATPELRFAVADAQRLPFRDGAFDIAVCSLLIHHLKPDEAVTTLAEMRRVARRGVVVNDLVRWWPGYWGAWLLSRLFSRNPLTWHDGPLSVRRAYTRAELRDLVARAGCSVIESRGFMGYRVALVCQ